MIVPKPKFTISNLISCNIPFQYFYIAPNTGIIYILTNVGCKSGNSKVIIDYNCTTLSTNIFISSAALFLWLDVNNIDIKLLKPNPTFYHD